jgi:hypothetical protein
MKAKTIFMNIRKDISKQDINIFANISNGGQLDTMTRLMLNINWLIRSRSMAEMSGISSKKGSASRFVFPG